MAPVLLRMNAGGHDTMADKQSGDILGLGGAGSAPAVNDEIANREASDLSDEAGKRRRRMSEGADEVTPSGETAYRRSSGATGIDMGAGGEGTDIE
jgi:hypothetical protein